MIEVIRGGAIVDRGIGLRAKWRGR
jgi:hypothetical protein